MTNERFSYCLLMYHSVSAIYQFLDIRTSLKCPMKFAALAFNKHKTFFFAVFNGNRWLHQERHRPGKNIKLIKKRNIKVNLRYFWELCDFSSRGWCPDLFYTLHDKLAESLMILGDCLSRRLLPPEDSWHESRWMCLFLFPLMHESKWFNSQPNTILPLPDSHLISLDF